MENKVRTLALKWAEIKNLSFATGQEAEKEFCKNNFYRIYDAFALFHDKDAMQLYMVLMDGEQELDLSVLDNGKGYEYLPFDNSISFGLYFEDNPTSWPVDILSTAVWKKDVDYIAHLKKYGFVSIPFVYSDGQFVSFYNI